MTKSIHAATLASAMLLTLAGPAAAGSAQYVPVQQQAGQTDTVPAPHYEWRYHYTGHHPEYRGYWALVR